MPATQRRGKHRRARLSRPGRWGWGRGAGDSTGRKNPERGNAEAAAPKRREKQDGAGADGAQPGTGTRAPRESKGYAQMPRERRRVWVGQHSRNTRTGTRLSLPATQRREKHRRAKAARAGQTGGPKVFSCRGYAHHLSFQYLQHTAALSGASSCSASSV